MNRQVNRRTFLKQNAVVGAGFMVLKSGILKAGQSPNEKLNIAVIGCGGRGRANIKGVEGENIVALCDVDEQTLATAAEQFPRAKTYVDWRKCLDQKDIDAVVTYLKNKRKLATQMGTQIHASDNFRRMVELIRHGAIGTVKDARVWCSRMPIGGNYLPAVRPVPKHVNWDLWIGPSPFHPYNPGYFRSEGIAGCLKWNRFWDFGSGQVGDMGSHLIDMAYWALDLRFPTTCEAKGTPFHPDTCPQWLTAEWDHPANDWRPAVKVYWYDGGKKPGMPSKIFQRDEMFRCAIFTGDKGFLIADYGYRVLMPKLDSNMTQYEPPKPAELIPPSPGHHKEWIIGCKTGKPTLCNFDYSGALIEHNLLSLVAYRVGKKLRWNARNLKATNCPEADRYIRKTYRRGWVLNG
jgi:predicted dehydrogenase